MSAPVRITGPVDLLTAVPYLLGFQPAESLVLIGLRDNQLTVTARVDLDQLDDPCQAEDLMAVLVNQAGSTQVMAITYGERTEAATVAATAIASGMQLIEHFRVTDGRYRSLICPIEGCCPIEGRPMTGNNAVAAEFVGLGASTAPSREDLEAMFTPVPDTARLADLIHDAEQSALADTVTGRRATRATSDESALFAAARREDRQWSDVETARYAGALTRYEIRDAMWLAIDSGRLDGRDLFLYLARVLPASHRAPALFLFGWKCWCTGNGPLAGMAVERALQADPDHSAAVLLRDALAQNIDPRQLPTLQLPN